MQFEIRSNGRATGRTVEVSPKVVLAGFAAVLLVMALGFWFIAGQVAKEAQLLFEQGVEVQAEVTELRISENVTKDSDGDTRRTTSYLVGLRFAAVDGATVEVTESVGRARFESLSQGQTISIFHVPAQPTLVGFEKGDGTGGGFLSAIAIVMAGLGLAAGVGVFFVRGKPSV